MQKKQIVCIEKSPTHHDRHHHITHVGVGRDRERANERLTTEEVIRQLADPTGDRFYVLGTGGAESEVIYKDCPVCGAGHQIITTTHDHTKTDNLLSLRECRDEECKLPHSGHSHFPPPPMRPPGPPQPPRPPRDRSVGRGQW
jgi:hypothetical protein